MIDCEERLPLCFDGTQFGPPAFSHTVHKGYKRFDSRPLPSTAQIGPLKSCAARHYDMDALEAIVYQVAQTLWV